MTDRLTEPDYQLIWSRTLFVREARRLLEAPSLQSWSNRCLTLLRDAFIHNHDNPDATGPIADYRVAETQEKSSSFGDPFGAPRTIITEGTVRRTRPRTKQEQFLADLIDNAVDLIEDPPLRAPLWSQRKAGAATGTRPKLTYIEFAFTYSDLVKDLDRLGYFDKRFGTNCIDGPRTTEPSQYLLEAIGKDVHWPIEPPQLGPNQDLLFDVVEALHDVVARPRNVNYHDFGDCGWHGEDFDPATGRAVYRWRVNKLLERTDLNLRLTDTGLEQGRLVPATDEARTDLVNGLLADTQSPSSDRIHHAINQFRRRGATREDKRNALAELAGVLEQRKQDGDLDKVIRSKDADALFHVANKFDIRHHNGLQSGDYPDYYLDWILYTFLASIELTSKITADEPNQ